MAEPIDRAGSAVGRDGTAPILPPRPDGIEVVRSAQRLAEQAGWARGGDSAVTMQVDTEALGPLRLDVMLHRRDVAAEIVASQPAAKGLLEAQQDRLQQALSDQGFRVDRFAVSVGDPGARSGGTGSFPDDQRAGTPQGGAAAGGSVSAGWQAAGAVWSRGLPATGVVDCFI